MNSVNPTTLGAAQTVPPLHAIGDALAGLFENSPILAEIIDRRLSIMLPRLQAEQQAAAEAVQQNEELVDKHVAAAELKVTPQTIWTWYQRGDLPGAKVGNRILFRLGDVRALLKIKTLPDGRRKYARRAATNQKSR
jgi:hypothetical protein